MKSMSKKVVSVLLATLMAGSVLLSGCQKADPVTASDSSVVTSTEPAPTSASAPTIDLKGRRIVMQAYAPDQIPDKSTKTGEAWLAKVAELEEKYNFNLVTLITQDSEGSETLRTSVMAGKPDYDISVIRCDNVFKLARDGVIEALDTIGFDFSQPQWEQFTAKNAKYDGKVYGMNVGKLQPRGVIFYNKRLFKEAGLPDPIEQTQAGTWTWDTFLAAAKKLTIDKNGDGVIDQYGVCGPSDSVATNLIYSNAGNIISGSDSNAKVTIGEPNAMKALEFFSQLTHKDKVLMPKNGRSSESWDWFNGEFKNTKAAMMIYSFWPSRIFAEEMADDYAFTLMPKGPAATDYVSVSDFFTAQVIPKNLSDSKELVQIWTELNSVFAEEGDGWKQLYYNQTKDPRCVDTIIQKIYDGANVYEPYAVFSAGEPYDIITGAIWDNTTTVEAAVQANKPVMEGKVKEFFNK